MNRLDVTLITDCHDANAKNRQKIAWRRHACVHNPSLVPITNTLEASGELVDALVEEEGGPAIIMAQSAPRSGRGHRFGNGTPFAYFYHGRTLVIASVDEHVLSLPRKVGLVTEQTDIRLMNAPNVLEAMVSQGELSAEKAECIKRTQFRSLKFIPRVGGWIQRGLEIPTERFDVSEIPEIGPAVWTVDNFGNCKLTVQRGDVPYSEGQALSLVIDGSVCEFMCIPELRNVPDGQAAITVGSSGPEDNPFLELVVQGVNTGSAQRRFGITLNSSIQISSRAAA